MENYLSRIKKLLKLAIENEASDLHLSVGRAPTMRVVGRLYKIPGTDKLTAEDCQGLIFSLMSDREREKLMEEREVDFSYDLEDRYRLRINVFFQRGSISSSLRVISSKVKTLEELNLPLILNKLTEPSQGLVLITGPSSHGKSTTLAGLIDRINKRDFKRIITIEDPIEYLFEDDRSVIDQREVNNDTLSFSKALRSALRQDPDVIMVGEMRDRETISTVMTAAETGHLVFSTLHTNSAGESIHRIIDSFPGDQQNQIRSQLATSLLGIVSQRLIPRKGGGLIPACEVMFSTPATANIIRENRVHELDLVIETSAEEGMTSLNKYLSYLIQKGEVLIEDAIIYSRRPSELKIVR